MAAKCSALLPEKPCSAIVVLSRLPSCVGRKSWNSAGSSRKSRTMRGRSASVIERVARFRASDIGNVMDISCFNAMDYAVEVVIREASSHVNSTASPRAALRPHRPPLPEGERPREHVPIRWSATRLPGIDRAMADGTCLGRTMIQRNQAAGFIGEEPIQQQMIALLLWYSAHQGDLFVEHHRR